MTAPKVSVIIPVYNTERYLARCLDSVIGQTERDIEIICVNDGSTDQGGEICEKYLSSLPDIYAKLLKDIGLSDAATGVLSSLITVSFSTH